MEVPAEVIESDEILQTALEIPAASDFKFGFKLQVFNFRMRKLRKLLGLTQQQLGKCVGVSAHTIGQIEGFRHFPSREHAQVIARELRTSVQDLFPEWLRFYVLDKSSREFVSTSGQIAEALENSDWKFRAEFLKGSESYPSNPEEYVTLAERDSVLTEVIKSLRPQQQKVLAMRFNLDGGGYRTLDQIAVELAVTRERIRAIELLAFESLRRPRFSRKLRDWAPRSAH